MVSKPQMLSKPPDNITEVQKLAECILIRKLKRFHFVLSGFSRSLQSSRMHISRWSSSLDLTYRDNYSIDTNEFSSICTSSKSSSETSAIQTFEITLTGGSMSDIGYLKMLTYYQTNL